MSHENASYEFLDFRLDIPERLLIHKGKRLPLSDKSFETLCVLVENAGHLVSKNDLMSKVWPDTIVEENNLDKSVSVLRHALGERKGKPKFIETVRGHGYRFIAEVRRIESGTQQIPEDPPANKTIQQTAQRPLPVAIIASLCSIVILILGWKILEKKDRSEIPLQKIESLAVLPLKNLSGDRKQDYFADGMTEELTAKLGGINSLRVISRTSVMEYKDARKPIPEIARELNVDAVLEGSILQVGDRVRVTVQLIAAKTDHHLWGESFERNLEDVLALQNEVATAISQKVHLTLAPEEASRLAGAPKVNPKAYDAYLRGLVYSEGLVTEENVRLAQQMFQKAVDLDPGFVSARAQLSIAESFLYFTFDHSPERLAKSEAALDRAFEIQPSSAEGHLARAFYYYRGFRNYDRALQEFEIAEKNMPNSKPILAGKAAIYRRQGKWKQALTAFQNLHSMNPRDPQTALDIGVIHNLMRNYQEAQKYFDQCISLRPDEENGYMANIANIVEWKGDLKEARKIMQAAPEKKNSNLVELKFAVEYWDRKYDAALEVLSSPYAVPFWKSVHEGLVYRSMNQQSAARSAFETARKELEAQIKTKPSDYIMRSYLGIAYAGLGRTEDAIQEAEEAMKLLPVSADAIWGPVVIQRLALIYTLLDEKDRAIDQLQYLLSIPSRISVPLLRIDPRWDSLRSHPRFQEMLAADSS